MINSLEQRITISVKEVGDLLSQIKGGGQVSQKNAVTIEADDSLRPLMDLLDGKHISSSRQLFIFSHSFHLCSAVIIDDFGSSWFLFIFLKLYSVIWNALMLQFLKVV